MMDSSSGMNERCSGKHVVLIGIGHTNAHIVRMWAMHAFPDTDLTCISNHSVATYSGLLPAVLAQQIAPEEMEIDLVRLCQAAGARLILDDVETIDPETRQILFTDRPPIYFDALSIGVGSVPTTAGLELGKGNVIKIKPMQDFLPRLLAGVNSAQARRGTEPIRIVIVGSGVAGIEVLFCLPPFLKKHVESQWSLAMVTRSAHVLPSVGNRMRTLVQREIANRRIDVHCGHGVSDIGTDCITLENGQRVEADLVVWATGASAPALLSRFNLPQNEDGFLTTDPTLRTTSGAPIFVVGDTGTIQTDPLPKAGVYAVRQGPVLWDNLQRIVSGKPLRPYHPQRSFLKLINLGNGEAIGERRHGALRGRMMMRLKARIDMRFMEKYRPKPMIDSEASMQCRGCGCKLGATALDSALAGSTGAPIALEDAAEIGSSDGTRLIASTDFFTTPFLDPYLTGRVCALHSASDIIATGARVTQALANVVLPEGDSQTQQRTLSEFLAGARREFSAMDAEIVGGHTIIGPRMEIGFTVIGDPLGSELLRKRSLREGDQLLITKPLGIGVLLAAHMRLATRARDYQNLIDTMLLGQHQLARLAVDHGVVACTDITGFGLAGHLLEMLTESDLEADVDLQRIPLLSGVAEAMADGIESSLAPENYRLSKSIDWSGSGDVPRYQALFDPQTCGGLLMGVSPDKVDGLVAAIASIGFDAPWVIGSVRQSTGAAKPLVLRSN